LTGNYYYASARKAKEEKKEASKSQGKEETERPIPPMSVVEEELAQHRTIIMKSSS
jgi:hypothetical protein